MPAKKLNQKSSAHPVKRNKSAIVAFIPVLHDGYRLFFEENANAKELYILAKSATSSYKPLRKEIRALDPELIKKAIESWAIFDKIIVADNKVLRALAQTHQKIILPNEDISKKIAQKYFKDNKVSFSNIFLRWDKHRSLANLPVDADQAISHSVFDKKIIRQLQINSEKESSDFWRRIGASIIKNKKILMTVYNQHVPSQHSPYAEGDPRSNFSRGIHIDKSSVLHAEAALIANAAKNGISLSGASLYVSTFPCPPCAKQVAFSGIKKLYYTGGYSVLDQERILKSQGVEIIYVDLKKD